MSNIFSLLEDHNLTILTQKIKGWTNSHHISTESVLLTIVRTHETEAPDIWNIFMPWKSSAMPTSAAIVAYMATILNDYAVTYQLKYDDDENDYCEVPEHIIQTAEALYQSKVAYLVPHMVKLLHKESNSYNGEFGAIWI